MTHNGLALYRLLADKRARPDKRAAKDGAWYAVTAPGSLTKATVPATSTNTGRHHAVRPQVAQAQASSGTVIDQQRRPEMGTRSMGRLLALILLPTVAVGVPFAASAAVFTVKTANNSAIGTIVVSGAGLTL